jgi:hypothetical protein
VGNNPVNFNDPSGHKACGDGEEWECGTGKKQDPKEDPYKPQKKNNKDVKDDLVNFLNGAATVAQDIAMLIDTPFAITEMVFIVGECIAAPPEGCVTGALMGEAAFNLSGANAAESILGLASLVLTGAADIIDDGEFGETTDTSFATFLVGGLMFDPIADLAIDGYASGYNHGTFNGIDSLMNGESLFRNTKE